MIIEQGVKIASGSVSITEDFKENEIIVVSHINDIEEIYLVKKIVNGAAKLHPISLNVLRKNMIPKLENPDLYYDLICECYELDTAIKIAKMLNEDLKRGDV